MEDIIAGISTPLVRSSLSIIRVSGKNCLNILNKIFIPKTSKKMVSFLMRYGKIINNFNGNELDEVLATATLSPNTYTKEDMFEISCHGNSLIVKNIFNLIIQNGARVSKEGEFTKRAFYNGRIDLTQAEAVLDLIDANSIKSISNSIHNLKGELKDFIISAKAKVLNVLSSINVVVDYPEEIEDVLSKESISEIMKVRDNLKNVISTYEIGRKIKEGIKVAIVGKSNVGKSSLINMLLREERAIVTDIAGTTRDIIEENFLIKGSLFKIIDTAGIRDTEDKVEKIGIELSKKVINEADFILFMLDSSDHLQQEDIEVLNLLEGKNYIAILNKIDLEKKISIDSLNLKDIVNFSTKIDKIEIIEDIIYNNCINNDINYSSSDLMINNIRHRNLIKKSLESIDNFIENSSKVPLDICAIDLLDSINHLSEITGEITNEDIIDNIFSNFCVGK